jgi:hypothetical protein
MGSRTPQIDAAESGPAENWNVMRLTNGFGHFGHFERLRPSLYINHGRLYNPRQDGIAPEHRLMT